MTAARHKFEDACHIQIEGIVGDAWRVARRPRVPIGTPQPQPQATPTMAHGWAAPTASTRAPQTHLCNGPREWIVNGLLNWHRADTHDLGTTLDGSHQAAGLLIELLGAASHHMAAKHIAHWISAHIRAMVRKKRQGKEVIWNWDIVLACVMLETTDFPQALKDSQHNARQVMSQCKWHGADRRSPVNLWSLGISKITPGANDPGKDAGSYAAGRDMNKCFLILHREANEELAKAIGQGRHELQQEHDATHGHKAHPRQPPLPPQPGNNHASTPDANTNVSAGA